SASNPPTAKDSAQLQTHPDVPDNLPLSAGPASLRFGPRLAARVGSGSASDLRVERDHRALRSARGAKAPALSAQQTLLRIGLVAGCVRRFSLGFELCPRTCATNVHVSAWREDTFRLPGKPAPGARLSWRLVGRAGPVAKAGVCGGILWWCAGCCGLVQSLLDFLPF